MENVQVGMKSLLRRKRKSSPSITEAEGGGRAGYPTPISPSHQFPYATQNKPFMQILTVDKAPLHWGGGTNWEPPGTPSQDTTPGAPPSPFPNLRGSCSSTCSDRQERGKGGLGLPF